MKDQKRFLVFMNILSAVFSPLYATSWIFLWLFSFTYQRTMPWSYKITIILMVFVFTAIIPKFGINVYRKLYQIRHHQIDNREHLHIPYILSILSFLTCVLLFVNIHIAGFMRGILYGALIAQIIGALINTRWKISTHMLGMGGLVGAYMAFSEVLYFNPIIGISTLAILSGMVGSARIIFAKHTLLQIITGFVLGYVCQYVCVLLPLLFFTY